MMKKYIAPEIITSIFDSESIITSSTGEAQNAMNDWKAQQTNGNVASIKYEDFKDVVSFTF